jgi:hypothetical protein
MSTTTDIRGKIPDRRKFGLMEFEDFDFDELSRHITSFASVFPTVIQQKNFHRILGNNVSILSQKTYIMNLIVVGLCVLTSSQ